jgi:hypothetical protein
MSGHSIAAPLAFFAFRAHLQEGAGTVAHRFYTLRGDARDDEGGDDDDTLAYPSLTALGLTADRLLDDIENAGRDLKWGAGRVDPEWRQQQRLVRGRAEFDLSGGPDVLHTSTCTNQRGAVIVHDDIAHRPCVSCACACVV